MIQFIHLSQGVVSSTAVDESPPEVEKIALHRDKALAVEVGTLAYYS